MFWDLFFVYLMASFFTSIIGIVLGIISFIYIKFVELFLPNNYLTNFLTFILGSLLLYIFINKINEILLKMKIYDMTMTNMSIELTENYKTIKQNSILQSNLQKDFFKNELLLSDLVKKYEEQNKTN